MHSLIIDIKEIQSLQGHISCLEHYKPTLANVTVSYCMSLCYVAPGSGGDLDNNKVSDLTNDTNEKEPDLVDEEENDTMTVLQEPDTLPTMITTKQIWS